MKFWRTYILWVWLSAGICQVGQSAAPATFQGLCFYCQFSFRAVAVLLSAVGSWAVVWPTVQASRPFRVRAPHAQLRGDFRGPRGTVERGIPSPSAATFPGSLGPPSQGPGQTLGLHVPALPGPSHGRSSVHGHRQQGTERRAVGTPPSPGATALRIERGPSLEGLGACPATAAPPQDGLAPGQDRMSTASRAGLLPLPSRARKQGSSPLSLHPHRAEPASRQRPPPQDTQNYKTHPICSR